MNIIKKLGLIPEPTPEEEQALEEERKRVDRDEHPFTRAQIKEFARGENLENFGAFELHTRVCSRCRAVFTARRELQLEHERRVKIKDILQEANELVECCSITLERPIFCKGELVEVHIQCRISTSSSNPLMTQEELDQLIETLQTAADPQDRIDVAHKLISIEDATADEALEEAMTDDPEHQIIEAIEQGFRERWNRKEQEYDDAMQNATMMDVLVVILSSRYHMDDQSDIKVTLIGQMGNVIKMHECKTNRRGQALFHALPRTSYSATFAL